MLGMALGHRCVRNKAVAVLCTIVEVKLKYSETETLLEYYNAR